MKRQYLGDARDAFKWEYQDCLVRKLGCEELQIVPMLTLDDGTNEGNIHSTEFPAVSVIHDFCKILRESRSLDDLMKLPAMTDADYRVRLHKPEEAFLETLEGIRSRFSDEYCAAIFSHSVMFITLSRSRSAIERVGQINMDYAADRELKVVEGWRES